MKKKRGLLDFTVTLVACGAVYAQTPVGALVDRGLSFVFGIERPHRALTSFFSLGGDASQAPSEQEIEVLVAARAKKDPQLVGFAEVFDLPYALLASLDLAGGERGVQLTDDQWRGAQRLLGGRSLPGSRNDRHALNVAAALVIRERARALGSTDAGLSAFRIGSDPVERAIALARSRGGGDPSLLRNHRRYLTRNQREAVEPFVNQVMAIQTALTFAWPIAGKHRMASGFGERLHPILRTRKFHNGVDLSVPIGTPIRAAHDGRVLYATYDGINGHYAKLDHGYGLTTAYCHNDELRVDKGDPTRRAQTIALSGNTGRSTGPHLHYIIKIGGKAVDPMRFR